MEEVVTVQTHRYKSGFPLRVTPDWQYIQLRDLEILLGLKRTNIRGRETAKIKVLDSTKNRVQGMTFIHVKHLETLCMRSARPVKCNWVIGLFGAHCKGLQDEQKEAQRQDAAMETDKCHDAILMVLENFWTRLPPQAIHLLETAVGRIGLVKALLQEDQRLRWRDKN
jgi:hypothetical protein